MSRMSHQLITVVLLEAATRMGEFKLSKKPETYDANVQPIEILSLIPAIVDGVDSLAMVIRPDPTASFRSQTVSISRAQALRFIDDAQTLLNMENTIWE